MRDGSLRAVARCVVIAGIVGVPLAAFADEPPAPPPPPPAAGGGEGGTSTAEKPPVPDPPPPDEEMPGWDLWFRDPSLPMPPPSPPPDPFAPRPIDYAHTREVSLDGRVMEVRRVPQWVDVVDRAQITEWRPLDLGDLLRRLPNVDIADHGSPFIASPVIRSLGGDRVKILTDGVWPSSQSLGVGGGTLSLWDPESIERVEVYHGPGASLRGLEVGGGMINIVPRRPWRHECFEAWGETSSAYSSAENRFRERVGLEIGQGRVAALGGFTWLDVHDRDTPDGEIDPSSYERFAADLAVDYFLDNRSTVGFTGQWVRADDVKTPGGISDVFSQPRYERTFLGLTLSSFDVGEIFRGTRLSIAFDQFLQQDDSASSASLVSGLSSHDDVTRYDAHLQGNLYVLPCHDTYAELSVGYAHVSRREEVIVPPLRPPVNGLGLDFGSVFPEAVPGQPVPGVAHYTADEWVADLLVTDEEHDPCFDQYLGVRLDWWHTEDDRSGDSHDDFDVGFAAGYARHLSTCFTAYGNASYGRRRPSLYETFDLAVLDGLTVFPNPDLNSETHVAGEVGIKATWNDHTSIQADAFVHWIGDFIGLAPIGPDRFWDNLGDVTLYGFEVTGAYRPCPLYCEGLELFGSSGITWSSGEDVVPTTPIHGRVGARYSICRGPECCGWRRWFVEGSVRGSANSEASDGSGGDAYATADVLAGIGWEGQGRRKLWATIGATNLFDAEYVEPFSRLPSAGVSLIASIAIEF